MILLLELLDLLIFLSKGNDLFKLNSCCNENIKEIYHGAGGGIMHLYIMSHSFK